MRKRLVSICIVGALLCGIYMYVRSEEKTSSIAESIEDIESAAGESPDDGKVDTVNDGDKSEAEGTVDVLQDIPDDGVLRIAIHNKEEYEEFISSLEEYATYSSLQLYLGETDTTIYLDEILAYQNYQQLYVENGGIISFKNTQILTYPIQTIELSHVYALEEDMLSHIMSGVSQTPQKIVIELDNRNLDKLPIEELLCYDDCGDIALIWDDDTWGGGLLDVQEGMESLREWDYLQSVQEATDGCLKGIYRLNDEDFSYTCYEFYNHYEEHWGDIFEAFICIKDTESKGEEYFDIIDVPSDKLKDYTVRRGTRHRLTVNDDLNFDGYKDLVLDSDSYDHSPYSGFITFLWDEGEQRFILNESAPNYIDYIDPERKRLVRNRGNNVKVDDYYIYEYSDNVFTTKHLLVSKEDKGGKQILEKYFENGKCTALLEFVEDENGFSHFYYKEIGGTREEAQAQSDLTLYEVNQIYFPELAAAEESTEDKNINTKVDATDHGDKAGVQEETESTQIMPVISRSGGYLTVKIYNKDQYEGFISRLEEFTDCNSLSLDLVGKDTTIYLDEILAYQNFEWLYIENGGTVSCKDAQILTYPIRVIELSHVYAIEESLLDHIVSGDLYVQYKLAIELDNRYTGKLPIEELLNYKDCEDVLLVWNDDAEGEGFLDVQEGMENLKEWDYLQSVQETSEGCLKGIYSLHDENYIFTCYEFYNHYEEYTADISAAFICVKDRESNGEEYFDIIDVPIDKFSDLYRGTTVNRLNVMSDINFDGYMDLEFHNQNNTWDSRSGYYFLWDEEEQRFVFNESAPRYIERIDPERKRLTNSNVSSLEDDYYIYEYSDHVFTCGHLKINTDLYGKKVTWKYFVDGKCISLLERIEDEDGSKHYFYEEIDGIREEVQIGSSLMYDEISEMFFPEFDFWIKG